MAIESYTNDVSKIKPLTSSEHELLLNEYAENRNVALRNKLVEQNLKLVFKVASFYRRSGIPVADLIAEGNLGLIRGIEKYDPSKGVKLGFYAFKWIQAFILRYIMRNAHMVRIGTNTNQRKLFWNLSKTKARLQAQQYEASSEEIAKLLGVSTKEVEDMEERMSAPIIRIDSYEADSNSDKKITLQHILESRVDGVKNAESPDALVEREDIHSVVKGFMERLDPVQKDVFESRILKLSGERDTFKNIGLRHNGLTKQRIQQIDAALKEKFKKYLSHNQISLV